MKKLLCKFFGHKSDDKKMVTGLNAFACLRCGHKWESIWILPGESPEFKIPLPDDTRISFSKDKLITIDITPENYRKYVAEDAERSPLSKTTYYGYTGFKDLHERD